MSMAKMLAQMFRRFIATWVVAHIVGCIPTARCLSNTRTRIIPDVVGDEASLLQLSYELGKASQERQVRELVLDMPASPSKNSSYSHAREVLGAVAYANNYFDVATGDSSSVWTVNKSAAADEIHIPLLTSVLMTGFPGRQKADDLAPFAKVRKKRWQPKDPRDLGVDIEIASPQVIVSVYLLLYVPLSMAWAAYFHYGSQEQHYRVLVPITMCSFVIGLDLVNQSLSALMKRPLAITAIQAGFMFIASGLCALLTQLHACFAKPSTKAEAEAPQEPLRFCHFLFLLVRWFPAALWFVLYQLVNHEVSYACSLSERTVFLNLCPLFALFLEPLVMPARVENIINQSFPSRMALTTMAFGAVLYSLQDADFTTYGLIAACLLVVTIIPYRLLQRLLLVDCQEVSATCLCSFDGLMLLIPSGIIAWKSDDAFLYSMHVWINNPSIVLMLALSVFAFIGNHLGMLYVLKMNSATSGIVLNNMASFVVVFEGIVFFGDAVMGSTLSILGIAMSLLGGMWYAFDQSPKSLLQQYSPLGWLSPPRFQRSASN